MHARIENNAVVEYPIVNLRQRLPNTSLPVDLTNDAALPAGFVYVHPSPSPSLEVAQKANPDKPVLQNGKWVQGWLVSALSSAEIAERNTAQAAAMREKRNALLADCDWTQIPDAPVDRTAWAAYRQALRDITAQAGFPWNVTWPVAP